MTVLPAAGDGHAAHLGIVVTDDRPALQAHLAALHVRTDVHYPVPDHRQPAWAAQYADIDLPVTQALAGSVLSVPVFPELTATEIERVGDALAHF